MNPTEWFNVRRAIQKPFLKLQLASTTSPASAASSCRKTRLARTSSLLFRFIVQQQLVQRESIWQNDVADIVA